MSLARRQIKEQSNAADIRKPLKDTLPSLDVFGNSLLVGIYVRSEKTKSGIILPDQTVQEDRWQSKVGLVLKKGPIAFVDDPRNDFGGKDVKVGDWVVYRNNDGLSLDVNGVMCRLIEDINVKMVVSDPSTIY